mgnify:CR=1 FL=1
MSDNSFIDDKENVKDDKPRFRKLRVAICIIVGILVGSYLIFVFAPIPFVRKWRNIYIETAMSTNSHQWLATMFIPGSIVDEVMAEVEAQQANQKALESKWKEDEAAAKEEAKKQAEAQKEKTEKAKIAAFFEQYWELDSDSVQEYLTANSIDTIDELDQLKISDMDSRLGLTTTEGDTILVCDIPNSLILVEIKGADYVGKLAIVKDPSLVCLGKSQYLGSQGELIDAFGENYDAIIAINASGFKDADGHGSGGQIKGSLVIDGIDYGTSKSDYKFFGMKADNKFYIANPWNVDVTEYRWGVQFFPALVVDGECVVAGTYGLGIQPRTAIGQTKDGTFLMLVVDGRQVGYSLGCTMEECANQLIRYGVYQAANMDGGSSSIMWYDGAQITKSSSPSGFGRYLPDALYIKKVD